MQFAPFDEPSKTVDELAQQVAQAPAQQAYPKTPLDQRIRQRGKAPQAPVAPAPGPSGVVYADTLPFQAALQPAPQAPPTAWTGGSPTFDERGMTQSTPTGPNAKPTGASPNPAWNTDGYAQPQYTAQTPGAAPAGWDPTKWADVNHQTPKYVVGRILSSYNLQDPAQRQAAIENIMRAYPGTVFDGKDKITLPGETIPVDVFGGAGAGEFRPQWMPVEAGGGAGTVGAAGVPFMGASTPTLGTTGAGAIAASLGAQAPSTPGASTDPTFTPYAFQRRALPTDTTLGTLAESLLRQAQGTAMPDTAGAKEMAKDQLLAMQQQALDAARSSAAQRGVAMGGALQGREADVADAFSGALTGQYREIDQASQQAGFDRLMALAQAAQAGGAQQFGQAQASGAFDFAQQQAEAAQQSGANTFGLNVAQLALDRLLGQGALANDSERNAIQRLLGLENVALGRGDLGLRRAQLAQQGAQFNRSASLDEAQAAQRAQEAFWDFILRGGSL